MPMSLRQTKQALLSEVGALSKAAKERDLTDAEISRVDELDAELESVNGRMAAVDASQAKVAAELGDPSAGVKPGYTQKVDPIASAFLAKIGPVGGSKTVLPTSGAVALPVDIGTVTLPYGRQGLAALVGQQQLGPTDQYSYLRQTGRTNNAAPVPVGGLKPTSAYELTRIVGDVVTVAHLSEPVPKQWLADVVQLQDFLAGELTSGLQLALGGLLLNGSTDPVLQGVLNTTGVLHQAAAANVLDTCRSALTVLQRAGEKPTGWVFTPEDWQAIETQRDTQNRYLYGNLPAEQPGQQLFGLPVELDIHVPAGTGLLGDWSTVSLLTRQGVQVDWSEAGDLFTHNQVMYRAECRVGLAIKRPSALTTISLTATP